MRRTAVALLLLLASCVFAQERYMVSLWQGGAKGAYSLTLDDFCGDWARGIWAHADPIARKEGIRFGFAVISGQCTAGLWEKARSMAEWGHEPVNHSWSHACPTEEAWCVASAGRRRWTDLALEIDSSTAAIARGTGVRPVVFAFPFDVSLPEQRKALEERGYVAFRASGGRLNDPEVDLPALYSADSEFPKGDPGKNAWQRFSMDSLPKAAAAQGAWGVRTMHGVDDASWGALPQEEFAAHMALLARMSKARELWVAPPGDVVLYAAMRDEVRFSKSPAVGPHGGTVVEYANGLDSLAALRPNLKLTVEVSGRELRRAWLGGEEIPVVRSGRYFLVDVPARSGSFEAEFAE